MENLWKVLEKALGIDELHYLAVQAKDELTAVKARLEEYEKGGEDYAPKEYPKMMPNGVTVWNEGEEAKESGIVQPKQAEQVIDPVVAPPTVTIEVPVVTPVPGVNALGAASESTP
jgi:hypothetical protein